MFRHEYPLRVNALIYQSEWPSARYLSKDCSRMFTVLKSVFGSLWSQTHNMKTIMWYKFKIISNNSQKIVNFLRSMCFLHHITKYIFFLFHHIWRVRQNNVSKTNIDDLYIYNIWTDLGLSLNFFKQKPSPYFAKQGKKGLIAFW